MLRKPGFDATASKDETFRNIMTNKMQTVESWRAEQDAYKAKRRSTVGNYNPSTGEREYGRQVPGAPRMKRMGR